MFRRLQAVTSCALLGMGFGACASDDNTGYQSGVDGNTQLGQLTPDQRVTICKTQAAYVHAHVDTTSLMRFLCAFTPAVLTAVDDPTCEAEMTKCVNAFSVQVQVDVNVDPNAIPLQCVTAPAIPCSGTVAGYENCVESLADVQVRIGTDFSCGKRSQYADGPTVGVSACGALGPTCAPAAQPALIR